MAVLKRIKVEKRKNGKILANTSVYWLDFGTSHNSGGALRAGIPRLAYGTFFASLRYAKNVAQPRDVTRHKMIDTGSLTC